MLILIERSEYLYSNMKISIFIEDKIFVCSLKKLIFISIPKNMYFKTGFSYDL